MTLLTKRSRVAVAVATAALSAASVFALAAPASAAAEPPAPVRNLTATGGVGELKVDWDAADTGEAATSYVIVVENANGIVGEPTIVLAPATEATIKLGAGTYDVTVFARNEYVVPGYDNGVSDLGNVVTAPQTSTPVVVNDTRPYRPYANWSDMIDQEYQLFTGCGKLGRLPRLDEKTFWTYNLQNRPLSGDADSFFGDEFGRLNNYRASRQADEWARLTNGATWDSNLPGGSSIEDDRYTLIPQATEVLVPSNKSYKTSIAYKALLADGKADATKVVAPATAPNADLVINGGNGDGTASGAEVDAYADNWARYSVKLEAKYGAAVNTLANEQAINDVYFDRREVFKTQLAEEAEQTDGPAYRLYTAYFSRIPDFKGLCYWSNKLRSGMSLLTVSDFFSKSSEFINTYGAYETYGEENATDAAEFVALIYKNVLVRDPDGAGIAFWTRQLQSERYSPGEVMIGFSESQEFKTRMAPRVGAGIGFAHLLGRMPTETEYVLNEFFGDYFATSPSLLGFSYLGDGLYEVIIDSAEYKVRAAL